MSPNLYQNNHSSKLSTVACNSISKFAHLLSPVDVRLWSVVCFDRGEAWVSEADWMNSTRASRFSPLPCRLTRDHKCFDLLSATRDCVDHRRDTGSAESEVPNAIVWRYTIEILLPFLAIDAKYPFLPPASQYLTQARSIKCCCFFFSVLLLYVAWNKELPWTFARFVLFCPVEKSCLLSLLCFGSFFFFFHNAGSQLCFRFLFSCHS